MTQPFTPLLALAAALLVGGPTLAAEETFAEVRARLIAKEASLVVSGDGERVNKRPTPFSRLLADLRSASRAEELISLAKHDRPMVRVMALAALAEAYPKQAFKALEARRYAKDPVAYLPRGGRKAIKISEGRLVSKLLFNSNLLRWSEKTRALITVPLPATEPKAKRFDWARCALLADADLLSVGGSMTGRGGRPCRFYVLTKEICAVAKDAEVMDLLEAKEAVVQVAGMVALVRRDPKQAAERLPKHFDDPTQMTLHYQGVVQRETLGGVARRLAKTPTLLD